MDQWTKAKAKAVNGIEGSVNGRGRMNRSLAPPGALFVVLVVVAVAVVVVGGVICHQHATHHLPSGASGARFTRFVLDCLFKEYSIHN